MAVIFRCRKDEITVFGEDSSSRIVGEMNLQCDSNRISKLSKEEQANVKEKDRKLR